MLEPIPGHVFAIATSLELLNQFHLVHIRAKLFRLLSTHGRSGRASGAAGTTLERIERRCALSHRLQPNLVKLAIVLKMDESELEVLSGARRIALIIRPKR